MIIKVLNNDYRLTYLDLSDRIVSFDDFYLICEGLKMNTNIDEVNLINSLLPKQAFQMLLEVLRENTTIKVIHMINSNLNDNDQTHINNILDQKVILIIFIVIFSCLNLFYIFLEYEQLNL